MRFNSRCRILAILLGIVTIGIISITLLISPPVWSLSRASFISPQQNAPQNWLAKSGMNTQAAEPRKIALVENWQFIAESTLDNNQPTPAPENQPLKLQPSPQLMNLEESRWQDIEVPGNWYLQNHDLSGVVWYRHSFKISPEIASQTVKLVFTGVDYTADVWLNGQYLGFHEGYFQPFSFLVTEALKTQEDNQLIVRVNSPLESSVTDWSLHKRLIKGVLAHHDARPGGAWSDRAQEQNTGGIWNEVYLQTSNQLTIDQVSVTPQVDFAADQGVAQVDLEVNYLGQRATLVDLNLQLTPDNFLGTTKEVYQRPYRLKPGLNHIYLEMPQSHPHLWQTWDRGFPSLYQLQIAINQSGTLLDTQQTKFGFRTIEYDQDSLVWKLNQARIFIRGTNYIGSQWLSELNSEKSSFDVSLMKRANINAVRVHAHLAHPSFYEQCDRQGILVWQDFPLQWGYQDDQEFRQQAIAQGQDMITLLYNHPSIMAWSLHNEPPWDAKWMEKLYQNYNPLQNLALDQELYDKLKGSDQTRYLHLASLVGEHPWWGWYSNSWQTYGEPTEEPLITEYGAQALPELASLRHIFDEDELYPDTEEKWQKWRYHNFQLRETFEVAKVPMGKNVQEFIDNTQQYQAKLTKFAAESYRRQRYQPVSAIFQFMFVENWPSVNWAIVDYWRNPKPGYAALKTAYQPILPSIISDQDKWELGAMINLDLAIINDTRENYADAQFSYTLQSKWQPLQKGEIKVDLKPDSLTKIESINFKPEQIGDYELVAKVSDFDGEVLGQNSLSFQVENPE